MTDLQASIERLSRCNAGEDVDEVYADFAAKAGQRLTDYVNVANAYLAALAAQTDLGPLPNHEPGKPLPMTPETWQWLLDMTQFRSDGDAATIGQLCRHLLAQLAEAEKPVDREWLVSVLGEPPWEHITNEGPNERGWFIDQSRKVGTFHAISVNGGFMDLETRADVFAFLRLARWPKKGD